VVRASAGIFHDPFQTDLYLEAAACRSHREPLPDDLVDELTWCSETFVEYGHYLRKARFVRRARLVAICLAVAVAIAAALWWYLGRLG
jgi:hypothetical protein